MLSVNGNSHVAADFRPDRFAGGRKPVVISGAGLAAQRQHAARRIVARHRRGRRAPGVLPVSADHQPVPTAARVVRRRRGRVDSDACWIRWTKGSRTSRRPRSGATTSARSGRTPNGIWGGKLMWNQTPLLLQRASGLPDRSGTGLLSAIRDVVGEDPLLIYVYRPDVVSQAVSFWRAVQTRVWRGRPDPVRDARATYHAGSHRPRRHHAARPGARAGETGSPRKTSNRWRFRIRCCGAI